MRCRQDDQIQATGDSGLMGVEEGEAGGDEEGGIGYQQGCRGGVQELTPSTKFFAARGHAVQCTEGCKCRQPDAEPRSGLEPTPELWCREQKGDRGQEGPATVEGNRRRAGQRRRKER